MKPNSNHPLDTRGGSALTAVLFAAILFLHTGYVQHHRVNVDEPQHLHVAWAWAHGLLPYRDVFDNHSPLFSILTAPVVRAIGERPDIVSYARLAMIPFTVMTLVMCWWVSRRLYSARDALWAAAICAAVPDFMVGSVEYRTDQLWTVLWMASMAVLLTGRITKPRGFLFGLLLGSSFGASMKTGPLVVSLAGAIAAVAVMLLARGIRPGPRWVASRVASALGGLVIVPGIVAAYFAARGGLREMIYGTVWHNMVPGLGLWHDAPLRALLIPAAIPPLWIIARRIVVRSENPFLGARRAVLFLTAGGYYVLLNGLWPLITRQDLLPFIPMGAIAVTPLLLRLPEFAAKALPVLSRRARTLAFAPALALGLLMVWTHKIEPAWGDNGTRSQVAFLDDVLRYTRPGELVMDIRGETIFRPRAYYYVLEALTQARIREGLIRDDIPERLVATRTPVAIRDTSEFPARARAFIGANYVTIGNIRVVGQALWSAGRGDTVRFAIRVPQTYAVVSERGPAAGWLDGAAYRGPRELAPGWHTYREHPGEGRAVVLWAKAAARGGSPFR